MADCYRCVTVTSRNGDGVGVCQVCGALACRDDGERDLSAMDFICGMCDATRLTNSSGLPPSGPSGGGPGGSGPAAPEPSPSGSDGGGAGGAVYASSADFERRRPTIAEQSREHRNIFRERIDDVITRLGDSVRGERAEALAEVEAEELDPEELAATAQLLHSQIEDADERGVLDRELLADAFGVAAWSIGADPGQEPRVHQLNHLADPRLRLAVGRFTPLVA